MTLSALHLVAIHWSQQISYPVLAALQILPLLALFMPGLVKNTRLQYWITLLVVTLEMLLAIDLYRHIDTASSAWQFAEYLPILGALQYHAAVNGPTMRVSAPVAGSRPKRGGMPSIVTPVAPA